MNALRKVFARARGTLTLLRHRRLNLGVAMEGRAPVMRISGDLIIDGRLRTRSLQFRPAITVGPGGTLRLGDRTFLNQGVNILASTEVRIGSRVLIGDLACIYDTNAHSVDGVSPPKVAPVIIEDDVWIGRGAVILPGVTIGRGSVVGTLSVVGKSVPRGTVVAGNPARIVRTYEVDDGFRRM
jgi:acetyltransferase-like isoleucine patch superfamily enzyme